MTASHGFRRIADLIASGKPALDLAVEASEAERVSLAHWAEIPAVDTLTADVHLERWRTGGVEVTGSIKSIVRLVCGVTLGEFTHTLDVPVSRRFLPPVPAAPGGGFELDPDAEIVDDLPRGGIDLGALIAEELSLALPDHPRAPGAELPGGSIKDAADEHPFAALARLKGKSATD
jgi:uncharacterized metal-binding protein YceD (DUF177 family)